MSGTEQFFDTSADIRVLIVGDLILDRYIHGKVSRISPEAPVPVVLRSHEKKVLGGAGNVAANISTLGGTPVLCGLVGDDVGRQEFVDLCAETGIDTSGVVTSKRVCTIAKTRFVSGGSQIIRFDEETVEPLCDDDRAALLSVVEQQLESVEIVVLSDYNKGVFVNGLAQAIIAMAKRKNVPVIADPKGTDYSRYHGATTLTPNLKELSEAVGRAVYDDEDVLQAGRELIRSFDLDFLVATRSERGMSIIQRDKVAHLPTRAREVFDVSGAGDTVVASISLALATGLTPEEAAQVANAAAAIAVSKRGTAQVQRAEVRAEMMRQGSVSRSKGTVLELREARAAVDHWRSEGLRVGFTNGCFDILHFGHVSLLQRARSQCDRLIVGMNSDASVSRLKGPTRPINNEHDRSGVLSALRSVDAVVLFEQDTPLEVITALEPDVLFKGADYRIDQVVGREVVERIGGSVILLDLEDGRSTTNVVDKIRTAS